MSPLARRHVARYAAPAAFLVAVTILIVLVHSALSAGGGTTTSARTTKAAKRTTTHATTTRKKKPRKPVTSTTATGTTDTTTGPGQLYTIQSGDTFGSIAAREGTTVAALEQLNPDVNPNALSVGQQIRVK